jgi:hypothetical protein
MTGKPRASRLMPTLSTHVCPLTSEALPLPRATVGMDLLSHIRTFQELTKTYATTLLSILEIVQEKVGRDIGTTD